MIDAGGKAWLTQSRPITTLYPLPVRTKREVRPPDSCRHRDDADGRPDRNPRVPVRHAAPGAHAPHHADGPLSPEPHEGKQRAVEYANPGLRMYVDLTPFVRSKSGRRTLLRMLPLADGRSAAVFPALLEDPRFSIVRPRKERQRVTRGREPNRAPRPQNDRARTAPGTSARLSSSSRRWCVPCCGRTRNCAGHGAIKGASKPGWGSPLPASPARRLRHAEDVLRDHRQRADPGHTAGAGCRVPDVGRRPQAAVAALPSRGNWRRSCGGFPTT